MDLSEEEKIKKELLDLILEHLRQNKIDSGIAQQQAQDFLAALPANNHEDLLKKLKELGQKYDEVNEVYLDELEKDSDSKKDDVLSQMREHIKQGNIDNAITAAKSINNQSVEIDK